jgi:hypothetical protein
VREKAMRKGEHDRKKERGTKLSKSSKEPRGQKLVTINRYFSVQTPTSCRTGKGVEKGDRVSG